MSDLSKRDFQRLDSDQDGRLSKEEVRNGLRSRGLPAPSKADTFFERADENGDGHISTAEYDKWVALRVKEIRAVYNTVDENGDGRLTTDELMSQCLKSSASPFRMNNCAACLSTQTASTTASYRLTTFARICCCCRRSTRPLYLRRSRSPP